MKNFSLSYFTMNEQDAIDYARTKLNFFNENAELECQEIGDGNLNYVFKIVDRKNGQSIIIKQAGPVARISDAFKLSTDRNRIESDILKLQGKLVPGLVPTTYSYDPVMNCFAMEDLSDYEVLRTALGKHKKFPQFADQITTFLAQTLLLTSDVVLEHKEKKELVRKYTNPELCDISECLVYTEPFYDCEQNDVTEGMRDFVQQYIWDDEQLTTETAKLKFDFMTNAQSLLHGDLHTGSILVKEDAMKVFDPEFAFYGPAGYDVGNVIANLIFAYVNALYTIEGEEQRTDYLSYLEDTITSIIPLFTEKFRKLWDEKATERTAGNAIFKEWYIASIIEDTAAVTGLELCRRIIGLAHVKDITSIEDAEKRVLAEKICLVAGKAFILERANIRTGEDFGRILRNSVEGAIICQ